MPIAPLLAPTEAAGLRGAFDRLLKERVQEKTRLDLIRNYIREDITEEALPKFLPTGAPNEVRKLAKISRVNMLSFVVRAAYQALHIEGYRLPRTEEDLPAWKAWRANQMAAKQIGLHRSAFEYGKAYMVGLPGEGTEPVARPVSPRYMTTLWGDDDMWPQWGLEKRRSGWRMYGNQNWYAIDDPDHTGDPENVGLSAPQPHGAGVTPIVRYTETVSLDDPAIGLVEPLTPLQDQIDVTTFGLMVAQHYGAFRQRAVIGWLAETESENLRAGQSQLWTFEDHPDDIRLHEFEQTQLDGYISSREATLRHMSTVSQTPAHELLGQLVNLSAEALAAAEASYQRAGHEYRTVMGEQHNQLFGLLSFYKGGALSPEAEVRWRDTESRSLAQQADALGKLAQQLNVPPEGLWEHIPNITDAEIERWKTMLQSGDAFNRLMRELNESRMPADSGANTGVNA